MAKSIFIECFGTDSNTFRIFCVRIQYFLSVVEQIQILLECFVPKSNTFRMFWDKMRNKYFSSNWITSMNSFDCLRRNSTLFECFGLRLQTFQMFCVQMWYISNVLCWNYVLFGYFGNQKIPKIFSLQNTTFIECFA